jgi:DNA-binding GntR family transcriptional regulator
VAPVTLGAVNDIFDLRVILEPAAARKAAGRVESKKLHELEAIVLAGYSPGDRESERKFLRANKNFHVAVAEASGNKRLAEALFHVLDEMERLFHLGLALRNRSEEMKHEHESLIEALVANEPDKAEKITIEQIESARRMVLTAIIESASMQKYQITVG